MPELAPVTSAFWPRRTLRTSHCGMTMRGSCSGITSRTRALVMVPREAVMVVTVSSPVLKSGYAFADAVTARRG
jgi:hypothetical protein